MPRALRSALNVAFASDLSLRSSAVYSRRTWAISAMLGTSTTPRSPGSDNSGMIRIDTRVLPVPHGSTSAGRARSRGIQSAGFRPRQRS